MNKIQLIALEKTITRWNDMAYSSSALWDGYCPLCKEFGTDGMNCRGCPIKEYTGVGNCEQTPYKDFCLSIRMDHVIAESENPKLAAYLCEQMLKQLCSYLPRTHQWYEGV